MLLSVAACGGGSDTEADGGSSAAPVASAAANAKVVPHEKLQEFLPTLPGWTREDDAQGTTDTAEGVSRVQVDYDQQGGIGGLGVEIMDTLGNASMLGPLRQFIKANRTETSGSAQMPTTTRPVTVLGFPAQEEWTPGVGNGTLGILVADRFTVAITGHSLSGADVMSKVAEAIDLKKLAGLR
jgi:hypothetical protein